MDIFSSLLSGPALATLAACGALGLVFRAITGLAREIPDLRIRFDKVKSRLDAQLTDIPAVKETIKEIQESVSPKKQLVQKLQDYYTVLMEIERKNAMAEEEKKSEGEIQMHRPGAQ